MPLRSTARFAGLIAILLAPPLAVRAEDAPAPSAPGPFHATPAGAAAIDRADLALDGDMVHATVWTTKPGAGAPATLRLDLPRSFPDLAVTLDGSAHKAGTAADGFAVPLSPKHAHRIGLAYTAHPATTAVARGAIATMVPWADYCLTVEAAVRFADQLAPGDTLTARRYDFPVAIDDAHPKTVQLTVRLPKDAHALVAFCGYLGRAAINPDKPVAAGVGERGSVKLIVLAGQPKG